MEEKPCQPFTFPSFASKLRPEAKAGSSVKSARCNPKHVCENRVRLEIAEKMRDLVLFNMAIDCKLRGRDLVRLKVRDVVVSGHMKERTSVIQSETQRSVQFEITEQTRKSVQRWIESLAMVGCEDLWPSCFHDSPHLSTRQYARSLQGRVTTIGLEPSAVGMHSMRRTKAAQICKKTATTLAGPVHSTLGQFSGNGPTAKEFARSVAAQRAGLRWRGRH